MTLLRVFVVASGVLLALGAVVLGAILTASVRNQAIEDRELSLARYADAVLGQRLVRDDRLSVGAEAASLLRREIRADHDIVNVKVWRADGVLLWTKIGRDRIGKRFPLTGHLAETLRTGVPEGELESMDDTHDSAEARLGVTNVLEVYAPIATDTGSIVGAYEIYVDSAPIEAFIADRKRTVLLATAGVFGSLWLLLTVLVGGASRMLRQQARRLHEQTQELRESYRRLEASSLEAIESLNATVEAKDPDTAGHSVRVQRIALAVGEELGLAEEQMDALRFGALFHDIGKLAVPDRVLTKPEQLTYWEYAQMKLHAQEGARIVDKIGRLRAAVPIVRHNHERWDGSGYPDGLAADEIPIEAAIVGLAEAWDAMTTDLPYRRALSRAEALAEIEKGRGTQFAPEVVDAFLRSFERIRAADVAPRAVADAG